MKISKIILASLLIIALFPVSVFAYIDPSVMTYTIQAIAGIVIAVGVGVGVYFHRVKKKINKTLKKDENEKKEVEEDLIVFNDEDKEDM